MTSPTPLSSFTRTLRALLSSCAALLLFAAAGIAGCADAVEEATCVVICNGIWEGAMCADGTDVSSISCDDNDECLCTCGDETLMCDDLP